MTTNPLYDNWHEFLSQLRPNEHKTRLKNFTSLMVSIFESKSVHLSVIANKIPAKATLPSVTRRLQRLLNNPAIRVREWYAPIARQVLERLVTSGGQVRLIVDGTKVGFGHQLLMVAVAYRRRTIPIAWTWVRYRRGRSSAHKQLALLGYVRQLLPPNAAVWVVGDSEFGANAVLRQLDRWQWQYVLRQKGNTLVYFAAQGVWKPFGSLVSKPGQSFWVTQARLSHQHQYPVNLLACWKPGEKQPWLLATQLPTAQATRRAYRYRMWIEEMFGDLKKHGFDLESTHLQHFLRLSRLTLAVALLYAWLLVFGAKIIKAGQRRLVDRNDRRDLSVFRIGMYTVHRRLKNAQLFSIRFMPVL